MAIQNVQGRMIIRPDMIVRRATDGIPRPGSGSLPTVSRWCRALHLREAFGEATKRGGSTTGGTPQPQCPPPGGGNYSGQPDKAPNEES